MGNEVNKFVIVSGAPECNTEFLKSSIDSNDFIIAADSGYKHCIKAGIIPDLIAGDFDSSVLPQNFKDRTVVLPVHKDDTDTLYCVKEAIRRGAEKIEIYSAIGSRADHTYSNILCLEYCRQHKVSALISDEKNLIKIFDKSFVLEAEGYKYFSLFSFSDYIEGLTIKNAEYTLDNYTLKRSSSICQSNRFSDGSAEISFKNGIILVILSND